MFDEKELKVIESIAKSLKRFVELKESEVKLQRIEVMLHENFPSSLLSSKTSPQKAFDSFYEDFSHGIK